MGSSTATPTCTFLASDHIACWKYGAAINTGRLAGYAQPTNLANIHLGLLKRMALRNDRFATSNWPGEELAG